MKPWTKEMLDTLTEGYPHRLNADLARELGVSVNAVAKKAGRLGLRKESGFRDKNRKAIYDRRVTLWNKGWFRKGNTIGSEHRFTGEEETDQRKAERIEKVTAARRRQTYDELIRIKYGLRRRTRLRLPERVFYVDKKKYIDDGDKD